MRRAIIVGHSGQDGSILWDQLLARGFALVGVSRHAVRVHGSQWEEVIDIDDALAVGRLVSSFRPEQIFYLAAHHHSSQQLTVDDAAIWAASWSAHAQGFRHFLQAIKDCDLPTRIFYAGSSRVFGDGAVSPLTENTPLQPTCVYGVTKAMGMMLADYYRRNHGLFVSCGILFNHESPLRGAEFVSQRIVNGLVKLKAGSAKTLQVGDLNARVDWGYAPDYTLAMQLIADADGPNDFIIASGETHSVREMIEIAAATLGLHWENCVIENPGILRRNPQDLCGDPTRLRQATGWQSNTSFQEMVQIMVAAAARTQATS